MPVQFSKKVPSRVLMDVICCALEILVNTVEVIFPYFPSNSLYRNISTNTYTIGGSRLNIYQFNGTIPVPTPAPSETITVMNLKGWNYLGCYNESTTGRALSGLENPIPGMNNSIEACSMACEGWTYFGVEYGEYILSWL